MTDELKDQPKPKPDPLVEVFDAVWPAIEAGEHLK